MERQTLTLRYEGLLADTHAMDAADSHTIIEGAKRLLAAHAYYYTTAEIPDRLFPEAHGFHVLHTGMRQGSIIYDFAIGLGAAAAWDLTKLTYDQFFRDAFHAWRERRLFDLPHFLRRQQMLDAHGPTNQPVFDSQAEREQQAQRLAVRTTQAMHQITVPLPRRAKTLQMTFGQHKLGTWTQRIPLFTEDEITHAVRALRVELDTRHPRPFR